MNRGVKWGVNWPFLGFLVAVALLGCWLFGNWSMWGLLGAVVAVQLAGALLFLALYKIPFVNYWVDRIRHEVSKLPPSDHDGMM